MVITHGDMRNTLERLFYDYLQIWLQIFHPRVSGRELPRDDIDERCRFMY